jgi:tRNA dimethylallyltransferase
MSELPKIVAIVGPTGSGKSGLGLQAAYKFSGEIVCADSRAVYRGMDIGTAKVLGAPVMSGAYAGSTFYRGAHHWLQDMVEPDYPFTVADWKAAAIEVIGKILGRHHLPIVVGGTGLYVQALVDNLEPPTVAPNAALRASLEAKPLSELVATLKGYDQEAAAKLDLKNPRRVVRALEVFILSGEPMSALRRRGPQLYEALQIGLEVPRQELYRMIDQRVDEMIKEGLFDEVRALMRRYPAELVAFMAIGYREVIAHFQKRMTKAQTVERIKLDTHSYARRQMTWLRRDKRVHWVKEDEEALRLIREFLSRE